MKTHVILVERLWRSRFSGAPVEILSCRSVSEGQLEYSSKMNTHTLIMLIAQTGTVSGKFLSVYYKKKKKKSGAACMPSAGDCLGKLKLIDTRE